MPKQACGHGSGPQHQHGFRLLWHLTLTPLTLLGINPDHDVIVIAHDGIGTQVNGEYRTQ